MIDDDRKSLRKRHKNGNVEHLKNKDLFDDYHHHEDDVLNKVKEGPIEEVREIKPGIVKILTNNARLIGLILIICYFSYLSYDNGIMEALVYEVEQSDNNNNNNIDNNNINNLTNTNRDESHTDNNNNNNDNNIDEGSYNYYLASVDQHIDDISLYEVNCSKTGYWREKAANTMPKRCGLLVTDAAVTKNELKRLRKIAERLIDNYSDTSTKVRESLNLQWINFHNIFRRADHLLKGKDYELVKKIADIFRVIIAETFGFDYDKLMYTNVTQITRYRPVTKYNEFRHIDKARSNTIVVTSILFLSTIGEEFEGGETEFLIGGPKPYTPVLIDPKKGRFAAWTSSTENPHGVLEVKAGERYAMIFGFTSLPNAGFNSLDELRKWSLDPKNITPNKSKSYYFVKY